MTESDGFGFEGQAIDGGTLGGTDPDDRVIGLPEEDLDAAAIRERAETLRATGYPSGELVRLVEAVASRATGRGAEEWLARLVEQLEAPSLDGLVKTHLMDPDGPATPDWTVRPGNEVAIRLSELGFEVRAGGTGKWTVTLDDGETLVRTYESPGARGEALCRLGLLAHWIRDMRARSADDEAAADDAETTAAEAGSHGSSESASRDSAEPASSTGRETSAGSR